MENKSHIYLVMSYVYVLLLVSMNNCAQDIA